MKVHYHSYDAVIVGAGGAGLRAAIEVAGKVKTAVITKLYPTRSHTGAAQGGMCAALSNVEEDYWEWHAFDTVKGSDYLGDQPAIDIMCKEAIDAVIDLEHFGMAFSRTPEGRIDQRRFGGHTRNHGEAPVRRSCYAADRTGHMILQTLYQQCVARDVTFFNEFQVFDILFDESTGERKAAGIVAYELSTGDLHVFVSKGVLFATGGYGKMFRISSNAHTLTGDGPGLLFRKQIPIQDLEFYQFHPTGIYGFGILLSEAARGEGGILRNGSGERFMERVAPTVKDLAPRDMVSRAIHAEIRQGRGAGPDKDYVYLDLTHLPPEQIDAKLPDISDFARTYLGIEPKTQPIPIQPTAHYAMGGIPTNVDGEVLVDSNETILPGLYAAGECACVSVHGANRLGTNSLLDIVVFGRRGGKAMAEYVAKVPHPEVARGVETPVRERIQALKDANGTMKVGELRTNLQQTMTLNASVVRTQESLEEALTTIQTIKKQYNDIAIDDKGEVFNYDLVEALELGHLLDLAEAFVIGALARKESRGAHWRDDFPTRDDQNWMTHTLAYRQEDGSVRLDYKPVKGGKYQPMERKY
ncbi:succinate dehydrogenase flavoprotein subunit [Acidithrix ferrooxidans]|uniref:Succinate dehydrogenase flavoprotein subunit n=1 Tax=Acidithrix ferrooxidans TaxID=1280514 RepID=A0A0D8HK51_9ACTN|nr:succinate dehydrogenase flavoprotein subunit [Acidithrix ferrooxidans]KJF18259.1 succinate dehydrogenase flavoprotein subunit [Acidithrix ferrooxidans]